MSRAIAGVYGVKVGQVWEDCDKRMNGRRLLVERLDGAHAVCTYVARPSLVTRIQLKRFRQTSTGFRLVSERAIS